MFTKVALSKWAPVPLLQVWFTSELDVCVCLCLCTCVCVCVRVFVFVCVCVFVRKEKGLAHQSLEDMTPTAKSPLHQTVLVTHSSARIVDSVEKIGTSFLPHCKKCTNTLGILNLRSHISFWEANQVARLVKRKSP